MRVATAVSLAIIAAAIPSLLVCLYHPSVPRLPNGYVYDVSSLVPWLILLSAAALLFSNVVTRLLRLPAKGRMRGTARVPATAPPPLNARRSERLSRVVWMVGMAIVVIYVAQEGIANLALRDRYLSYRISGTHPLLDLVSKSLIRLAPLAAGVGFSLARTRFSQIMSVTLIVGYSAVQYSAGSRLLPLGIAAFVGAWLYLARPRVDRRLIVKLVVAVLLVAVAYALALFNRSQSRHGLVPYAGATAEVLNNRDVVTLLDPVLRNIADLSGTVELTIDDYMAVAEPREFWVSVNPAPGRLVGWYEIYGDLRHSRYPWMPYSAIGELFCQGPLYVVFYFVCAGLLLNISGTLAKPTRMGTAIVWTLALLFAITLFQYNLRSVTRLLYYALAASILSRVIFRYSDRLRSSSAASDSRSNLSAGVRQFSAVGADHPPAREVRRWS